MEKNGPQKALRYSTLVCASMMATGGLLLGAIDASLADNVQNQEGSRLVYHTVSRVLLWLMLVLQSGFVQLLMTQHWSFIGSIQTSAVWFSPIAGIGSVSSTLAAFAVSPLVERVGLGGLLWGAALLLVVSACCGEYAYQAAEQVRSCHVHPKPLLLDMVCGVKQFLDVPLGNFLSFLLVL